MVPDLVFDLPFKAKDELVSQMDDRLVTTASPRLQDHQQRFHGLVAQARAQVFHDHAVASDSGATVGFDKDHLPSLFLFEEEGHAHTEGCGQPMQGSYTGGCLSPFHQADGVRR